jgi:hypothetical protein
LKAKHLVPQTQSKFAYASVAVSNETAYIVGGELENGDFLSSIRSFNISQFPNITANELVGLDLARSPGVTIDQFSRKVIGIFKKKKKSKKNHSNIAFRIFLRSILYCFHGSCFGEFSRR